MMLDRMLEADLAELDGVGDTVIARHVRSCERCRAVARQLRAETKVLAAATAGAPRFVSVKAVGAVLAAATLVLMLLPRGSAIDVDAGAVRAAGNDAPTVTGVRTDPQNTDSLIPIGARQFTARPFARAQAVAAVPVAFDASNDGAFDVVPGDVNAVESDVVVAPPAGVRAAVMRGSAPGVTVIWLH
ncbi:MAG TPA: hypothetical protein VJR92_16025 [Gemmatimonadaceae bacterium]|nr:hypothetical protein [Gemmatimonadaceae bacterium]